VNDAGAGDLVDRLAIQDLVVKYAWAIDEKDWDALDTVFLPDAWLDYSSNPGGASGHYPEIRAWLEKSLAPFPVTQHLVTNIDVSVDGDRATSRTMVYNPMGAATREGPLHYFFLGGRYDDELVRTDAGWRIAKRVETLLWFNGTLPKELIVPD
jgi:3-phenylpropionate/cinnamic acid dioxygenase small subunit